MGFGRHIWAMTERIGKTLRKLSHWWPYWSISILVERGQLKIYKGGKKKEKWGSCNYALNVKKINQWLWEFNITTISKESGLMDRQTVILEIR